jgi:hypothetical protein
MRLALIALLLSGCALGTWNPKRPDHTAVGECSDVLPYKKGPDNTGELSAKLTAEICERWAIPLQWLTVEQVKDGETRGICGHVDVTEAFHLSTHTDPGKNFPKDRYVELVQQSFAEQFPLT